MSGHRVEIDQGADDLTDELPRRRVISIVTCVLDLPCHAMMTVFTCIFTFSYICDKCRLKK